jgi:pantoate kinase
MLKKHPAVGRLVQMPAKVVSIVGFKDDHFIVRVGTKKNEKVTESFMMQHGVLVKKDWQEKTTTGVLKPIARQEYVNQYFRGLFEARREPVAGGKIFSGFVIEDEVIEDFVAIVEE